MAVAVGLAVGVSASVAVLAGAGVGLAVCVMACVGGVVGLGFFPAEQAASRSKMMKGRALRMLELYSRPLA